MSRICIVPAVGGTGGMASFRGKFEAGLSKRGIEVTHDAREKCDAALVIGGTRALYPLWKLRQAGVRIVQRLDGINWIQRRRRTGLRHRVRAEYGNLILAFIRRHLATHVVYQSEFTQHWWNDWYGQLKTSSSVVHNGVDLEQYRPEGPGKPPLERCRLLVVEGSLGGGYEMGLDNAVRLAELLETKHGLRTEVLAVGKITDGQRATVASQAGVPVAFAGAVMSDRVPELDRSAHVLFSADLHPACPNSVIEALACGTPVVGFDTGALREIVTDECGGIVPYGGDPWKLEGPDLDSLAQTTASVLADRASFSRAARLHAEEALGLEKMMQGYLAALLEA
jgi:glycosyltransferase involved in cell wall biosynthesis